ncbi:hypothetical protein B7C62_28015 [Kitasatospora albolonga]|uniref:Tryptophan-rich sensory protein n=1 Tax=Kitasatospora albolonga TaxID=68173 RepID=A0ABC8C065_9ACTN|nr:hypothetical protein B7C62_28015 [Kitasatospora albolonga]
MRAVPRPVRSLRRAFLITIGLGWAGYGGIGIINNPRYGTSRGLAHITRYVPLDMLGWMWVVCGAVAVVAGLLLACPRWQAAGFVALAAPAALWGAAFTTSAIGTYPQAAGSACGWAAFAIGILWVSGMEDPLPSHLRKRYR